MKHIGHTITDADLAAYADHETSSVSIAEIEQHLAQNPEDAARVETWRKQSEALRAVYGRVVFEPLPPAVSLAQPRGARLEAPIGEAADPDAPIRQVLKFEPRKPDVGPNPARQRLTLVLLCVLLAALFYLVNQIGPGGVVSNLLGPPPYAAPPEPQAGSGDVLAQARRAGEAHRTYATSDPPRPGEWLSAQDPSLAAFLSRRTGLAITLPDFASSGLKLRGGRITPGELGPAAFLLYEGSGDDRIGLLIARTVADDSGPTYREDRATGVLSWTKAGAAYALTASGDADRLMRLYRLMAN